MQVADSHTTHRSTRLERLIRLYETGQASEFMDQVLDKVFAQEAAEEETLIAQLRADLDRFEARYGLDSGAFYERFSRGEMGDDADFVEWASVYDMVASSQARLALLTD